MNGVKQVNQANQVKWVNDVKEVDKMESSLARVTSLKSPSVY